MNDFTGKTILITGASRGFGRIFALHLAKLGASIGIICRNLNSYKEYAGEVAQFKAENVEEELKQMGAKVHVAFADLTDYAQVEAAVKEIIDALGVPYGLICNAGGGVGPLYCGQPSSIDMDEFDLVVHRNLYTTANTIRAAVPYMKEKGEGSIITLSSHSGQNVHSTGGYAAYVASKAAITQYTRSLAQEIGPFGLRANAMSPGFIGTGRLLAKFQKEGEEKYAAHTALKRLGKPEEVASVVEFLLSDMSSYVTGTVIEVNGGTTGKIGI